MQSTLRPQAFGLRFFDADFDGYQDLILANGHIEPEINSVQKEIPRQTSQLLEQRSGRMVDISEDSGPFFLEELVARGLAAGDDGDGDLDVLLTTNAGPRVRARRSTGTVCAIAAHTTIVAPLAHYR